MMNGHYRLHRFIYQIAGVRPQEDLQQVNHVSSPSPFRESHTTHVLTGSLENNLKVQDGVPPRLTAMESILEAKGFMDFVQTHAITHVEQRLIKNPVSSHSFTRAKHTDGVLLLILSMGSHGVLPR